MSWLIIYTGDGKGKTTAALGLLLRARGRALPVAVVQFIKGRWPTGERAMLEAMTGVELHVMGRGFTWDSDDLDRDRDAARAAWGRAVELIEGGEHAIVILDELTYCLHYGFLDEREVVAALTGRPAGVDVVVTGRDAPPALVGAADLVTEMRNCKHPFQRGIKARKGIDY